MILKDIRKNNLVEKYLYYIQEDKFLSDITISIDLDKFISGKSNKLIIAGLSGSGKTTLCRSLADKYNTSCFETDICLERPFNSEARVDEEALKEIFNKMYFNCIEPRMKTKKREVIEGGAVFQTYVFHPELRAKLNYPVIILGTSSLLSSIRSIIRKGNTRILNPRRLYKAYLKNFVYLSHLLKTFREERIKAGGDIKEFVIPKDIIEA